jgi:hypothetical protein
VSDGLAPAPLPAGLGLPATAWQQTPLHVRLGMHPLLTRLASLETRWLQDASHASRPPATASPSQKRARRPPAAERRQPGATPGPPGQHQVLVEPTAPLSRLPEVCSCGPRARGELPPSRTPPVRELPCRRPDVTPWLRHRTKGGAGQAARWATRWSLLPRSVAAARG